MNITVRRSAARGHAEHGWLSSRHSFSFADYYDPRHMGFRSLRVINEDVVQPAAGFPTHGHRDMEIISYVIDGELEHKDSTGSQGVIRRGEVQYMSAGTGVRHSEYNASASAPVHFLQIWIVPQRSGMAPRYEQVAYRDVPGHDGLTLVAAPGGGEGALSIAQDARLYMAKPVAGDAIHHVLAPGRAAWIQVVSGRLQVLGQTLDPGDGAAIEGAGAIDIGASSDSELLLFDLA